MAFTHDDGTLANAFLTEAGIRLFDFETCGVRHARLDGSFPVLRYMHFSWAQGIPEEISTECLNAYREELVRGCPEAAEDSSFYRELVRCSAGWLAGLLRLPNAFEKDQKWGTITFRTRILAGLTLFADLSERTGELPMLGELARSASEHLQGLWNMSDTPSFYPAFDTVT